MAVASAPASSANLGPGFDVLALALELRCRVVATRADGWSVEHGEGRRPEVDSDDAVIAAARAAVGDSTPMCLEVSNEIPIGRGLGSSAAALAAGAAAALAERDGDVDADAVFDLVCSIEGHPDNAAAAIYGGLILVSASSRPLSLEVHPSLRPVVAVPADVFLTSEARRVVSEVVGRDVAVRTVARAVALVAGFQTGDPELLAAAEGDEIHEAPRAVVRPHTEKLLGKARAAGAFHAAWSGSGPSVIALVDAGSETAVVTALSAEGAEVLTPSIARDGLVVSA